MERLRSKRAVIIGAAQRLGVDLYDGAALLLEKRRSSLSGVENAAEIHV